jgi:hypothetical protein
MEIRWKQSHDVSRDEGRSYRFNNIAMRDGNYSFCAGAGLLINRLICRKDISEKSFPARNRAVLVGRMSSGMISKEFYFAKGGWWHQTTPHVPSRSAPRDGSLRESSR